MKKEGFTILVFVLMIIGSGGALFAQQTVSERTGISSLAGVEEGTHGYIAELVQYSILTLEEFIVRATQNPFFEEILMEQLELQYSEVLALPADDWILSVKTDYVLAAGETDTIHGFNGGIELAKLFNESATQLSTGWNLSPGAGGDGNSSFFFNLAQPIGQNAFGRKNRWISDLAGINNSIIEIQIVEAYEDYFASLLILYYNWYSDYSRLLTTQRSYQTSEQLLYEMISKQEYRIADELDVNKSRLQLLSRGETLISIQSSYKSRENEIRLAIGSGEGAFRPELKDFRDFSSLDFDELSKEFFNESRTAAAFELLENEKTLSEKITADELLPSAEFYGNYSLTGNGYGFEDGGLSHGLSLGIQLNYSILSEKITAKVEKSQLEIDQTKLSNQNKILKLKLELDNLSQELETSYEIIGISQELMDLSSAVAEDEENDYNLGTSDLNFLIQAINSRDSYESQLISKRVQFNSLMIEFLRLTDNLVVKSLFELD